MILAFFVITLNSVFYYQQIGSGFGYGIIVGDYNGDTVDDILVSAPFFSSVHSTDTGRVFVFLGTRNVSLYNNMENTIYHTVGTDPKSHIKIVERGKMDTPSTQIHDH